MLQVPYWVFVFLGALLLGILLLLFYLYTKYTKLIGNGNKTNNVINETEKTENNSQFIQQLSRREQEVIEAIVAGNTRYKELAGKLNISVNTVKFHLKNIYQITGVPNLTALSNFLREFSSSGQ
jgi:DNA-binding CsgD family transcriptional regulator